MFKYLFQNVAQIIKTNILRANNCLIKFAHGANFIYKIYRTCNYECSSNK